MSRIKEVKFQPCKWEEIQPLIEKHIKENSITVDSYWEDHVCNANHYKMICDDEVAGYFAIYKEGHDPHKDATLVLFNVFVQYASQSQEIFARVKKYETVTKAMVVTGDEVFLSHCFDNFLKIEKVAYFVSYPEKEILRSSKRILDFRVAKGKADYETFKLSKGFLDEEIDKFEKGVTHLEIYIAEENSTVVGFGIVEYGRAVKDIAAIGMYVCEDFRRQGMAVDILHGLKNIVQEKGFRAVSGCWYYNHNSKKSLEKAGAYCKTRLIRFYF